MWFLIWILSAFFLTSVSFADIADTEQKLTGSAQTYSYYFGRCVSVSGKTLIAGASGDSAMGGGAGAAYIFENEQGAWVEKIRLLAPDGVSSDRFGKSVTIFGDYAVVGAGDFDNNGRIDSSYLVMLSEALGALTCTP